MFNKNFGHLRLGLSDVLPQIEIKTTFTDNLDAMVGFGEDIPVEFKTSDTLNGGFTGNMSPPCDITAEEDLKNKLSITSGVRVDADFKDSLHNESYISENSNIVNLFDNLLEQDVYVVKDIKDKTELRAALKNESIAYKNVTEENTLTEMLNCNISSSILEEEVVTIQVTIPPGGELRMDSDLFSVALNGVNILHLHQGDWIYLDRKTTDIKIGTGTGGKLEGKILYKERYL